MSKITIKEVAKRANVSTATVSRVLNNNYPVSDEARKEVLKAASELNYKPNGVARSLKKNKTKLNRYYCCRYIKSIFHECGKRSRKCSFRRIQSYFI